MKDVTGMGGAECSSMGSIEFEPTKFQSFVRNMYYFLKSLRGFQNLNR